MFRAHAFVYSVETGTASLTKSLSWEDEFVRRKQRDSALLSITPSYANVLQSSTFHFKLTQELSIHFLCKLPSLV